MAIRTVENAAKRGSAEREASEHREEEIERRALIDRITQMRPLSVSLCYHALGAVTSEGSGERNSALAGFSEVYASLQAAAALLKKGRAPDGIAPKTASWLTECVGRETAALRVVDEGLKMVAEVKSGLDGGSASRRQVDELHTLAAGPFRDAVTKLAGVLAQSMFESRSNSVERSRRAMETIEKAMERILGVSMSVRLISLNASVEAARAGAAGKGFGVIAHEIQRLAGEIQDTADEANQRIAEIQREQPETGAKSADA